MPMFPVTRELMLSPNYASVEFRMWPSTWIFDCRACSPDPYRSRTLSASLFSSSLCLFLSIVTFQEFPPGRFSNINAKASLFSSIFPPKSRPPHPHPHKKHKYAQSAFESAAQFWSTHDSACTWRLTFWPFPSRSWPLNSLLIIRPSPPMNLLPRESQETGSCDPVV